MTTIGEQAFKWVSENPDKIAKIAYDNRAKVFQYTSNAQRFVSKNIKRNPRPIRYLKEGEIHAPNHNFTGPGTRIDLPAVRNHAPYNPIDGCSRVHDLEFNRIFKMKQGPERRQAIRNADKAAIDCYNKYPNEDGYMLAKGGINLKMRLEDLSPAMFNKIMGEDYRGAEQGIVAVQEPDDDDEEIEEPDDDDDDQVGGFIDPLSGGLIMTAIPVATMLYGEYRLAKNMYDKLTN